MTAVNRYERGARDTRPWGTWEVIDTGDRFTVKRIVVKPGAQLSLQLHHGRDEHWTIVSGKARVTCGDDISDYSENAHIFIPVETQHRIENPGNDDLVFIEVQYGKNLDENDIVRLEDKYGRV